LRDATPADLTAIFDIYDHYVRTSTCTFQRDPDPPEQRAAFFAGHDALHPIIVAERDGEIVGWGKLSTFRGRWGYRHTVENSLYVHHARHRLGIGSAILADLIARAGALGHHTIIAGVSADQAASLALHERHGFREVGRLPEVGHKLDRWLDVVFLQRML
jgi:phosphinothricin acetyltransferase